MQLDSFITEYERDGYFIIRNFASIDVVSRLSGCAYSRKICVNSIGMGDVRSGRAIFNPNVLFTHPETVELVSKPVVQEICQKLLGDGFHLKFARAYRVFSGYDFTWHTDNKDAVKKNLASKGVVFNLALSDTKQGGKFQIVRGSHKWSNDISDNNYDDYVLKNLNTIKIDTLEYEPGDLIVFNEAVIHRPEPIKGKKHFTLSLLWQVVDENMGNEPTVLNTHSNMPCPELAPYFNIGRKVDYPLMPSGSEKSLPFSQLTVLIFNLFCILPKALLVSFKNLFPRRAKLILKSALKK